METNRIIRITFKSMKSNGENFREQENIFKREYKCTAKVAARGSKSGSTIGLKFEMKKITPLAAKAERCMDDFDNVAGFGAS